MPNQHSSKQQGRGEVQTEKLDCFTRVCFASSKRDEGAGHAVVMPSERRSSEREGSSESAGAGGSEAWAPPACCAGSVVPHANFLAALRAVVRSADMLCGSGRRRLGGRRGEPCGGRRLLGPFTYSAHWEVRRGWLPRLAVGVSSGDPCQEQRRSTCLRRILCRASGTRCGRGQW